MFYICGMLSVNVFSNKRKSALHTTLICVSQHLGVRVFDTCLYIIKNYFNPFIHVCLFFFFFFGYLLNPQTKQRRYRHDNDLCIGLGMGMGKQCIYGDLSVSAQQ